MKAILRKLQTAESLFYAAQLEYCAAAPRYFRTGEMRSRTTFANAIHIDYFTKKTESENDACTNSKTEACKNAYKFTVKL